jgi:hypothetical protein
VSLKARLNRLEADVTWMAGEGHVRYLGLRLELARMEQEYFTEMARREAATAEALRRKVPVQRIPKGEVRSVEVPPEPAPPPPELPSTEPSLEPPTPESPVIETFDIPEHMQIRPTRWRLRGPEDYDWDAGADPPDDDDPWS